MGTEAAPTIQTLEAQRPTATSSNRGNNKAQKSFEHGAGVFWRSAPHHYSRGSGMGKAGAGRPGAQRCGQVWADQGQGASWRHS